MGLEDLLKTVMWMVKRKAGELRLYPLHLLCAYLMSELRNIRDEGLASEVLSLVMIQLSEARNEYNVSLQIYVNILPKHDLYLYVVKLLYS
jgi:hypothetical protein